MKFADLFPQVHNGYELILGFAFLLIQAWQFWVLNGIKKNTNGLVAEKVDAARETAHSQGMRDGTIIEQARVAAKLEVANQAAQQLAQAGSGEAAALAAAVAAPAALQAAAAAPPALAAAATTSHEHDPDIHPNE